MDDYTPIGDECFIYKDELISYKGQEYIKTCGEFVMDLPDGGSAYCTLAFDHPGNDHINTRIGTKPNEVTIIDRPRRFYAKKFEGGHDAAVDMILWIQKVNPRIDEVLYSPNIESTTYSGAKGAVVIPRHSRGNMPAGRTYLYKGQWLVYNDGEFINFEEDGFRARFDVVPNEV